MRMRQASAEWENNVSNALSRSHGLGPVSPGETGLVSMKLGRAGRRCPGPTGGDGGRRFSVYRLDRTGPDRTKEQRAAGRRRIREPPPGSPSHPSRASEADRHLVAVDDHGHLASPLREGQHAVEGRRVLLDVDGLESGAPPCMVLTGGQGVRSRVLAEDVDHGSSGPCRVHGSFVNMVPAFERCSTKTLRSCQSGPIRRQLGSGGRAPSIRPRLVPALPLDSV